MSNKKLFVVFSALAIALVIPLTIRSVSTQSNTQSHADTSTTAMSSADPVYVSGNHEYSVGVTYKGKFYQCYFPQFKYKVDGNAHYTPSNPDPYLMGTFCAADDITITPDANGCNTFTMPSPPPNYQVLGIVYRKWGDNLGGMSRTKNSYVTLCGGNYNVLYELKWSSSTP